MTDIKFSYFIKKNKIESIEDTRCWFKATNGQTTPHDKHRVCFNFLIYIEKRLNGACSRYKFYKS